MDVVIGTFNMSFASDLGLDPDQNVFPSEASFLQRNKALAQKTNQPYDVRKFWKNSLKLLTTFITTQKPVFVGLQEMELTEPNQRNKITNEMHGTAAVDAAILELRMPQYTTLSRKVAGASPTVTSIWNQEVLGPVAVHEVYAFLHKDARNPDQIEPMNAVQPTEVPTLNGSRPMLYIYTTKGFLLINIHGENDERDSGSGYQRAQMWIQKTTNKFLTSFASQITTPVDPNKVLFVGDCNDRYNGIGFKFDKEGGELKLSMNPPITLQYIGHAPNSCCYNWDSSCSEQSRRRIEAKTETGLNIVVSRKPRFTCTLPEPGYKTAGPNRRVLPMTDEEGALSSYQYTGDYCLAAQPVLPMQIYRPAEFAAAVSSESDHELVYAVVRIPNGTVGGKSRGLRQKTHRRRSRRRYTRRHRKTHRHRRHA